MGIYAEVWEMKVSGSKEEDAELLAQGWEPFAVTKTPYRWACYYKRPTGQTVRVTDE